MNENHYNIIESAKHIPEVDAVGELNEKIEKVKQLRQDGEGWYDACLRVAENDSQTYVLLCMMLNRVENEREN